MASWQITDNKFDFSVTHTIAASKELVYQVLANMEAYPEFINDLVSVRREGSLYHFVARAAILTIPATLLVTETPDRSVDFELVEGPVEVLTGSWRVEEGDTPSQTKITLNIHAETGARGEWLLRMTGKYVENKTDKLIAAFSDRVEALERGEVPTPVAEKGFMAWLKRLWARLFGKAAEPTPAPAVSTSGKVAALYRDDHSSQTLEALAATMLPPDDFDAGVQGLGFVSVVEMRARYEAGREELYTTALNAVDKMAQDMFGKSSFIELTFLERTALLDAARQNQVNDNIWRNIKPSSFFGALWEDVVFLYCTHPDTWMRIGFPGPSFNSGGYAEAAQPQKFMGQKN